MLAQAYPVKMKWKQLLKLYIGRNKCRREMLQQEYRSCMYRETR
ncbi:hypothetical protein HanXRQr2_Chr09g0409351 [Helianthus annuus]|uniref:Uncharacterized protein n=1 Tax=Helianthus annuus TaxID=4232 RepID=A0A9K3I9E9_HELAN|nr:hypothetical protein HanXRQr2_Chr09g0409351 [Helianthus annuus]